MSTQIPFTMGQQTGFPILPSYGCWYRAPADLRDPDPTGPRCFDSPLLDPYAGWTYTAQSAARMVSLGWEVYLPPLWETRS